MADLPSHTRGAMLTLAIRCLDLTSLDGSETPEDIEELCARAHRPDPDPSVPSVAAVVLYPANVRAAAERLRGTGVRVASVAGFPVPDAPIEQRLEEIRRAAGDGAEEIDIVLNRELVAAGRGSAAADEVARSKEAARGRLLKVILETGELGSSDRIRQAARVAMEGGADFVKSSTGKLGGGVSPDAARAMSETVAEFHAETGRVVGVKVSGGVRSADDARGYLELVEAALGPDWLTPERFRIGASALLDDLVRRIREGSR